MKPSTSAICASPWWRVLSLRSLDDPNYVTIDLEFDARQQAENLLAAVRPVWSHLEATVMMNSLARIMEVVEKGNSASSSSISGRPDFVAKLNSGEAISPSHGGLALSNNVVAHEGHGFALSPQRS